MKNGKDMKTIITDAVFAMIERKPLSKITIEEVVKEADIARSSFYRHYNSIEDVVRQEEDRGLEEIAAINEVALYAHGKKISSELTESQIRRMEYILEHRDHISLLLGPNGDPALRYKADKKIEEYLREKFSNFFDQDDIESEFYIKFMLVGRMALIRYWIDEHPEVPAVQIAEILNKLLYSVFGEDGK